MNQADNKQAPKKKQSRQQRPQIIVVVQHTHNQTTSPSRRLMDQMRRGAVLTYSWS